MRVILSVEQSLKTKPKGARIDYNESVYLFNKIVSNKGSMTQIATDNEVSLTTLYNIKKELSRPLHQTFLEKPIKNRIPPQSPSFPKLY